MGTGAFVEFNCLFMPQESSLLNERVRSDFKEPRRFRVILYNDDFTTFDFVKMMLMRVFRKSDAEAERLTLQVHREGKAIVGVYTYDVALSRRRKALMMAREESFPLRIECEPADD